jgi:class 3 adenylate cyclase
MSATPDSTLANPEQRIADLERQLAEREAELAGRTAERDAYKAERDEALEQQTATAEVLQVINSSPGDLVPVFEAILEKGHTLCDIAYGSLQLYDGNQFRAVATRGFPEAFDRVLRQGFRPNDNHPARGLITGEPFVHVPDNDEVTDPTSRAAADLAGIRTVLFVPLRRENVLLGQIVTARTEVRPFSDKEIALLQNFAAQAVIAMENARLLTETREALEQQTGTAEVLQVINSSPGDLTPVFDAMLEKALRLCEAAVGSLVGFDGERFQTLAQRGLPAPYVEYLATNDQPGPGGGQQRVLQGERVVHFADMKDDEAYRSGKNPAHRALVDFGGARTGIVVPLRKDDDTVVGTFTFYRKEVRPFTDKQIVLLQNFAAQAVIAMENARLLGELRQRTDDLAESLEYQTAISDVLKVISQSAFELEPVLKTVIETAMRLSGNDSGAIFLLKDASYRLAVQSGMTPTEDEISADYEHVAGDDSLVGRTARDVAPVHILDSWTDPLYGLKDDAKRVNWRTMLGVPLLREGIPLGVICVARHHVEAFAEKQIELVRTFADQAVIAMENARLLGELRQRTDEVAELNRGLEARVAEQVEELSRVGRLKRFLAPQLAELIVSHGDEKMLESHRREIVVVFCDLRGYTAFTETAEPEEVLEFLRQYHGELGPLVSQFEGTLDQFSGDGIMVFFNDPVPCPDPAERAVKMAMAMREAASKLIAAWRHDGCELGFGVGIAQGYATLGQIGFSDRSGYTAIGTVCNLSSRLCAEAKDGQILVTSRVARAVEAVARLEDLGNLELKGLRRPVAAFNVARDISPAEARPNLTVVAREPGAS